MNIKNYIIILVAMLATSSCTFSSENTEIEIQELYDYFETEQIDLSKIGNNYLVKVKGSKLIERKYNEHPNEKQEILDQYSSTGALISNTILTKEGLACDSVIIEVENNYNGVIYRYSSENLKQVRNATDICKAFVLSLNKKELDSSSVYLDTEILAQLSKDNFVGKFDTLFPYDKIDSKLISFEIKKDLIILSENVHFHNGLKQTYLFFFRPNNDKIAGIKQAE
jgi:hypothetical protein